MTNNANWLRLESVIQRANMTINYFGRHIGLNRSEQLYQIKSGQHGISQALARRIVEKFPEISLGWLITGEGEMLNRNEDLRSIPFYQEDISRGIERITNVEPYCHIGVPMLEECDFAIRSMDDAMKGEIMVGTILFLKKTDINSIIPGAIYVIVCANYVILRRVRFSASTPDVLRLEATNPDYDEMSIATDSVKEIYRVVGNLKLY